MGIISDLLGTSSPPPAGVRVEVDDLPGRFTTTRRTATTVTVKPEGGRGQVEFTRNARQVRRA